MQGGKRRRNASKELAWRKHLRQQARSGLSVRGYCQQHDLAENSFYAWRREVMLRDAESSQPVKSSPAFAAVTLIAAEPRQPPLIEIVLTDPPRIAVEPGFDPETLRGVLAIARSATC
jgi:hypothetical protein